MRNRKIDIIIPAYKGHSTIWQTLCSIASQTIINDIEVTIVNDCCPEGSYQMFVSIFSPYMTIKEVKADENKGLVVARQKGIDSTNNEYITFINVDDVFYCTKALDTLRKAIEETVSPERGIPTGSEYACVTSSFFDEKNNSIIKYPYGYSAYLHGKLYRREFLEKHKVQFGDIKADEDTSFNTVIRMLCCIPENPANDIDSLTYLWRNNCD